MNLYEWEGTAGKPAIKGPRIDYDYLHEFDVRQADSAVEYIKEHAKDAKPFFMDVNFMKMHNPNIPANGVCRQSRISAIIRMPMLELDSHIGKVMDAIRAEAPDTIVVITADNGAWQDAWPDAGVTPFRGEKGSPFEGGFRMPGIMWAPGKIPAGATYGEMMSHIDCWATLATMVGLTPPPHGEMDGQRRQADLLRQHRQQRLHHGQVAALGARTRGSISTVRTSCGVRADIGGDPENPDLQIAWKYLTPPRTPGLVRRSISAPSARSTTSPWIRSRNTT